MRDAAFRQMKNALAIKAIFDAIEELKEEPASICESDIADIGGAWLQLWAIHLELKRKAA